MVHLCSVRFSDDLRLLHPDRTQIRLERRLEAYRHAIRLDERIPFSNLEDETGESALNAIEAIHRALLDKDSIESSQSSTTSAPTLGARDLNTLRTLLSILSSWKLACLVSAYDMTLGNLHSATLSGEQSAKLQEIPDEALLNQRRQVEAQRYSAIFSAASDLLKRLGFILGLDEERTEVSNAVLRTCSPHIVALASRLAWGPLSHKEDKKGQSEKSAAATVLFDLLRTLSTSSCLQILAEAGHVRASKASKEKQIQIPTFVKAAVERLYSAQLLRTDGVMALLRNIFGSEEEHGSDLMKKLAGVGHLLSTPPPRMSSETFASINVPRLMDVISELPTSSNVDQQRSPSQQSTSTHKTASCFALARIQEVAPEAVKTGTKNIIWRYIYPEEEETTTSLPSVQAKRIQDSVQLLFQIVEHSEPSTTYLSFLISPMFIPLFTLCAFLKGDQRQKIGDMKGKETDPEVSLVSMSWSLLKTWLQIAEVKEACKVLSPKSLTSLFATSNSSVGPIPHGEDKVNCPYWDRRDGQVCILWKDTAAQTDIASALSTLQLEDLQVLLRSEEDSEMNTPLFLSALALSPSPTLLASLLKDSSRKDVCSQLLIDLIESYTSSKQKEKTLRRSEQDTVSNSVIFVQHILELIQVFGSEVLTGQIDKILSFIDFALGSRVEIRGDQSKSETSQFPTLQANLHQGHLAGLINIGNKNTATSDEAPMEDEESDDDLIETALNLLLSLLEGNPDVSSQSHSLLKIISAKLEVQITRSTNSEIHSLAKEARLVLTARQSSKSSSTFSSNYSTPLQQAYTKGNELYQEALRLLQDPILPVRAHGLIMLKELAGYGSSNVSKRTLMDPALTSAILDIYIQAIQDDESFLYLNAVKGIAEIANVGGKKMITRLVGLYLGSNKEIYNKGKVDMQLRMGEALLQVIQKLEEALLAYVDEIVYPLLTAIRQFNRPTTLRSSYLSVLGTCVEACPAAFTSTLSANAIVDAMLDLLSIESKQKSSITQAQDMQDPTHVDTKLPQLRRAAILLLALFINGSRHQLEIAQEERDKINQEEGLTALRLPNGSIVGSGNDSSAKIQQPLMFPEKQSSRTSSILGYIAQTDNDDLVRHQSQQLLEEVKLLALAYVAT